MSDRDRRRPAALPVALLILLALLSGAAPAPGAVRPAPAASRAMVATPDRAAAEVALEILRAGGNAVDAAVATGFALAVTYPQAGNIGGGGFMLIRLADGRSRFIDYRETAPARAHRKMFLDAEGEAVRERSQESYLAVGVPGTVAGLILALERFGTLPLERILAPAISLAEEGFAVPAGLSARLESGGGKLKRHPQSREIFMPGGKAPAPGALLVQKDLGRALREIARGGAEAFYRGPIAEGIAAVMRSNGGLIDLADLAGYRALIREPVRLRYRDHEILTAPPPSAGGIVLGQMLHMLEARDVAGLGWGSSAYLHLMAEVMKRAYADRATYLGDPDQIRIPVKELLSREYALGRISDFDPQRATPSSAAGPGEPAWLEKESTTHFSIADARGNVVSNTYTLNGSFGMGAVVDGWGFLLNNEMDDFSAKPGSPDMYGLVGGSANAVAPRKRMLSSMTPTIVLKEGRPYLVLGTPGGGRITTMVLQVLLNVIDFEMELQAAVDRPRCHHQWAPDILFCEEEALSTDVEENLRRRGHRIRTNSHKGDIQAILFDLEAGGVRGASDARGYGTARGY